jgi:hypothetical protein
MWQMKHPMEALTTTYNGREHIRIISLELPGILFHTLWADTDAAGAFGVRYDRLDDGWSAGAVDSDWNCVIDWAFKLETKRRGE